MPAITIRDVPEPIRDELAARAKRSGRSLQEYLKAELARIATDPDPEDWLARVRGRVEREGSELTREQILEAKDADRR